MNQRKSPQEECSDRSVDVQEPSLPILKDYPASRFDVCIRNPDGTITTVQGRTYHDLNLQPVDADGKPLDELSDEPVITEARR